MLQLILGFDLQAKYSDIESAPVPFVNNNCYLDYNIYLRDIFQLIQELGFHNSKMFRLYTDI